MERPKRLILIGFLMVLFGFVAPFLMVLEIIKSTFVLNFVSHAASVGGLFLGMIGAALYTRTRRNPDN
jgi:membrane associated rhomboid family serine protease